MRIDIAEAKYENCDGYVPVFQGDELRVEGSLPEISLINLRRLLDAGLQVEEFVAGPDRSVIVVFKSGERYLATGFTFGDTGELTWAFCQFIDLADWGSASINFNFIASLPHDWEGYIPIAPRLRNPLIDLL